MGKLTDARLRNASTDDRDVFLSDGDGLYLRVRKSGTKLWLYRYKAGGATKWFEIGSYPDMALTEARAKAVTLTADRRKGIDPVEQKREQDEADEAQKLANQAERERLKQRHTVESAARRWFAAPGKRSGKPKSEELIRRFERDVFPKIGDMALEDVKKGHVREVLATIEQRGALVLARHMIADLRQFFDYCVGFDWIEASPAAAIKRTDVGTKADERDRVLSDAEIRSLPAAIDAGRMAQSTEHAIWIMLATCCRVGEISRARWEHIDLEACTWTIPPEVAKNGCEHIIYLSGIATQHFESLRALREAVTDPQGRLVPSPWVMPAKHHNEHLCVKSIAKQIGDRQRGERGAMSNRTPHTDALILPGGKWTPHDLRRTGATMMAAIGVLPEVVERCLNHLEQNRMKRIYQRHDYAREMREAWRLLGERIELLTSAGDNVVTLRNRA